MVLPALSLIMTEVTLCAPLSQVPRPGKVAVPPNEPESPAIGVLNSREWPLESWKTIPAEVTGLEPAVISTE